MVDAIFRMVSSKCGTFFSPAAGFIYSGHVMMFWRRGCGSFPGGDLEFGCAVKIRRALVLSSHAGRTSQHELDFELCS